MFQRTVESSLAIRLRTMQSCYYPADAYLPPFVQVLLAVGRNANTSDIGLECVGVQRSQECVQSVHTHRGFGLRSASCLVNGVCFCVCAAPGGSL